MYPFDNPSDSLQSLDNIDAAKYKPIGEVSPSTASGSVQQQVNQQLIGKAMNPNPMPVQQAQPSSHFSNWGMSANHFGERDPKTGITPFSQEGNAHLEDLAKNNIGLISSLSHMSSAPMQDESGSQAPQQPGLSAGSAMKGFEAYQSGEGVASIIEAML